MAQIAQMTPRGFRKLVHSLNVPHQQDSFGRRALHFDLSSEGSKAFLPFFSSFRRALAYPHLKPFYSFAELGKKMNRSWWTIRRMSQKMQVPTYKIGRKTIIFLSDIFRLGKLEHF
jgi:hypothetical protein